MVPFSLSQLVLALIDRARAELVDVAGTLYGKLLCSCSRRTLETLERLGLPGVGWALVALAMRGDDAR